MNFPNFADRLIAAIVSKKSFIVVGLDPHVDKIPAHLWSDKLAESGSQLQTKSEVILEFNRRIIDSITPYVVAVKPQVAFYERFGHWGIKAFRETIAYAQTKGLLVIADAKRGDIGSTAQAYSDAYLGGIASREGESDTVFDVDALTVNPYFGSDGIEPFKNDAIRFGKGLFILVRTSNSSAADIQDLDTPRGKLHELVGELVHRWGEGSEGQMGYRSIGAVVGATYPKQARRLREIMPKSFFLVPGYGTQGASAADVMPCFNSDGYGAVVNSSRALIFAYLNSPWRDHYSELDFAQATVAATIQMRDDINAAMKAERHLPWSEQAG